jgi:hypothetical protein
LKTFEASTSADHIAGRIDAIDMLTLVLDSDVIHFAVGVRGSIPWDDPEWGEIIITGAGALGSLDVPENAFGPESRAITARLYETYMPEGSDTPVNIFDDGVRLSIDEEEWEGRTAILSILWLSEAGTIIEREQLAVREIDQMYVDRDGEGNQVRVAILEEPDITQRDIEAKTANAASQLLIDATDNSFKHVGTARLQKITFGQRPESTAD